MPPPPPEQAVLPAGGLGLRPVAIPKGRFWRQLLAFSGPGYLVAVGYMDPGNWATGLAGGSSYGYRLLSVIVVANVAAMFLQSLAAKLGLVTGLDLAQACRRAYSPRSTVLLWLLCELAIVACDLAELLGAAVALKLLFGLPLLWGVSLLGFQVLLLLALQRRSIRPLEILVFGLTLLVALCCAIDLILARPAAGAIVRGLVPGVDIVTDRAMLYVAIGIVGATVMPHNLYLHSALVKSRCHDRSDAGVRGALRFHRIDTVVALTGAAFVNAAILILAASIFHRHGAGDVGIEDAYRLLSPAIGAGAASTLFGVALLASGQNASITGTLAGQIVLEGFTDLRIPRWLRQVTARLLAIVPAVLVIAVCGEASTTALLILSQVVLSLQLPFAVVPLVRLTGDRRWMGRFANGPVTSLAAWGLTITLIALNFYLLLALVQ